MFDDRALDQSGLFCHQFNCSGLIDTCFLLVRQVAPCCASPVKQSFPAGLETPLFEFGMSDVACTKVMKFVFNIFLFKPTA